MPEHTVQENIATLQAGSRVSVRDKLYELESQLLQRAQVDIPTEHLFAHGVYSRQVTVPKGVTLTGAIHKYSHINVILKGDISVATEFGVQRIKAPAIFVAPAGSKRAGYAHEETVFINIHGTHETDVEKLEVELVTNDYAAFLESAKTITHEE